jgi:two-component system sensor histidine kinase TctE
MTLNVPFLSRLTSFSSKSLRFQLLFSATCILLLISLLTLIAVKRYAYQTTQMFYDHQLNNAAQQIIEQVRFDGFSFSVDIPTAAFKSLAESSRDKVFYLVSAQDSPSVQRFITGYQELLDQPEAIEQMANYQIKLEPEASHFYLNFKQEWVRFALLSRVINTREGPQHVYVLVGQTTQARQVWEKELTDYAIKLVMGVVLSALLVIIILIIRVLKPVNQINNKMGRRSPLDLTPINLDAPQEVKHLVDTINVFMNQLDENLTNLKNFTGHAAHQLKTPIAGIRAQIDLAKSKTQDPETIDYLNKVTGACSVLERTVEQLLNHATIRHRYQSLEPKDVDVNRLTKEVCRGLAMNALSKNIELCFDESLQFSVKGDEFSLSQMLINLLENAIKYSPNGSNVEVEIIQQGSKAVLLIRDYGPGIAEYDKPYVFEKFYRSPNATSQGTGLGMSIAKEVARQSHALLVLEDTQPDQNERKGLTVKVQFSHTHWTESV